MVKQVSLVGMAVIFAGAGCQGEIVPPSAIATALAVVTNPSAQAQSGVALFIQPVVELRDVNGNPVSTRGVLVTAAVAAGGGSLGGETAVRTGADGRAAFTDLAITGTVGVKSLRFSSSGLVTALSSDIDVSAGPASSIAPEAGNNQTAAAGTMVAVAPAVKVLDTSGNPVIGVTAEFEAAIGGGMVAGSSVTTNGDGVAEVGGWTLGPMIGQNRLRATVGNLEFLFTATSVVGPPSKLVVAGGDNQAAVIGASVANPPSVMLTDAFDNAIAGVKITFAAAFGGGSVTGASPTTDATGTAKVGSWRLGLTPGAQTLMASRAGVPSLVFTATANDFQVSNVTAGGFSTCAVATTGEARCWGANGSGQLGDGTATSANVPVAVFGGTMFTGVAIGAGHACGVTVAGAGMCWGNNLLGQLGDGTTLDSPVPVVVAGGLTFSRIAVGDTHTCGLATNGAGWCWGGNGHGRLGDATTIASSVPVAVSGGHTFTSLAAGSAHNCAVRADGQLFCWGFNGSGRLGDGTTNNRGTPTAIAPAAGAAAFTSVAAGGSHSCGVDIAGQAFCWGAGGSGALGTGNSAGQLTATRVAGTQSFIAVAAGFVHTCGIATGGALFCWGVNANGRLGDGTTFGRNAPTAVAGQLLVTAVRLGVEHTCARTSFGSAVCWGGGAQGQLGDAGNLQRLTAIGVTPP